MIRLFPRIRSQRVIGVGVDQALFGISLPSDCILNSINAEVHVVGQTVQTIATAIMYGIQGYVLPVLDPDAGAELDTVWDTLVPKDDDTDTIDLDTGAVDAQSMFEPGEAAMAEVLDLGLQPQRIYASQRMKSWANANFRQEQTDVLEWVPSEVHKIRVGRKRYHCKGPSVVIFALGNADMLDTSSGVLTALAENEWPRVKYMGTVLEQALMQHFGLVEAGAETPWVEAAQLLRKYLEPDVHEETAGAWSAQTLRTWTNVTFDVSVPGTMDSIQIGTGG